jgi:hypothetical protein
MTSAFSLRRRRASISRSRRSSSRWMSDSWRICSRRADVLVSGLLRAGAPSVNTFTSEILLPGSRVNAARHFLCQAPARWYLAYGSRKAPSADPDTEGLCHLIRSISLFAPSLGYSNTADSAAADEQRIDDPGDDIVAHQFNWRTDPFDFAVFKSAITRLLDNRAPKGDIGKSPYPGYPTPDEVTRTLVALAEGLNRLPRDVLLAHAEQRDVGSLFHAFAQSARDLKTGEDK